MAKFHGHKNRNHWNVNLWINNDEGLYSMARECVRKASNRDEAASDMLEILKEDGITHTPDDAPYSKTTIRAAMVGII